MINGFDSFTEVYQDYAEALVKYTRECPRFGIYFVITSTGSITPMVENSFPQKIAMRYLDTSDYGMLFNHATNTIPGINPGRGLIELDSVYEFQVSQIFEEDFTIILDPPRSGCSELVLNSVADIKPSRVIYISCNPISLAKDLRILTKQYDIEKVQPFDMFPQTANVETMVVLTKKQEE